jgi:cathepsin L
MMKFLIVAVAMLAFLGAASAMNFDDFLTKFGKSYDANEYELRKTIFDMNKLQIDAHNEQANAMYTLGYTKFADMTTAEFDSFRGYKKVGSIRAKPFLYSKSSFNADDAVDWRTAHNPRVLSPVKDQKKCGSCWAFSATESIEAAGAIFTGEDAKVLSPQQFVDCTPNPNHCGGTGGCDGATAELAFEYQINSPGLALDSSYPYTAKDGKCLDGSVPVISDYNVTGMHALSPNDVNTLLAAVQKQPVSVSVDASEWKFYTQGIWTPDGCDQTNPDIDHAVQLVGYGTEGTMDYWIIRNSWGPDWGENGFMRLQRFSQEDTPCGLDITPEDGAACEGDDTPQKVCGTCGILADSSVPVVGQN